MDSNNSHPFDGFFNPYQHRESLFESTIDQKQLLEEMEYLERLHELPVDDQGTASNIPHDLRYGQTENTAFRNHPAASEVGQDLTFENTPTPDSSLMFDIISSSRYSSAPPARQSGSISSTSDQHYPLMPQYGASQALSPQPSSLSQVGIYGPEVPSMTQRFTPFALSDLPAANYAAASAPGFHHPSRRGSVPGPYRSQQAESTTLQRPRDMYTILASSQPSTSSIGWTSQAARLLPHATTISSPLRRVPTVMDNTSGTSTCSQKTPFNAPFTTKDRTGASASDTSTTFNALTPTSQALAYNMSARTTGDSASQPNSGKPKRPEKSEDDSDQEVKVAIEDEGTWGQYGSFFANFQQAQEYLQRPKWSPPKPDPTIPTTDTELQDYHRRLCAAVVNLEGAQDTATSKHRPFFEEQRYKQIGIEATCWKLLQEVIDLHNRGFFGIASRKSHQDRGLHCGQRLEAIIKLLEDWKSACVLVLNQTTQRIVIGPHKLYMQSKTNKSSSEDKKIRLAQSKGRDEDVVLHSKAKSTWEMEPNNTRLPYRVAPLLGEDDDEVQEGAQSDED